MFGFEPTDDQKTLIESVRRFAARELRPGSRAADESGEPAAALDATPAGSWRLLPASLPEEHGGFGERSVVTGALFCEELAWGDVAGALALLAPDLVALPVLLCGSERAAGGAAAGASPADSYVPGVRRLAGAALRLRPARALDDARARRRRRVRAGRHEVQRAVRGRSRSGCSCTRRWTGRTQAFLVAQGHAAASWCGERERNMGLHALPLYAVELDGLPRARRASGWAASRARRRAAPERVARRLGRAGGRRARARRTSTRSTTRRPAQAFGEAIAQRQSIAFMLAEMATEIEAARLLVWEAAWRARRGQGRDAGGVRSPRASPTTWPSWSPTARCRCWAATATSRDHPVELWLRNGRGFAVLGRARHRLKRGGSR